ncbi:MAG: YihY/virulence factor BrkB family protein [Gemmatimonadales bacterium]|nr:MAG: YihY/virulence factor BrkB family protein [Gemmatimonadales bacterium]
MTVSVDDGSEEEERPAGKRAFLASLWRHLEKSDLFFMAGAISFNVVIAVIPLVLLVVGIAGFVLSARYDDPTAELLQVLLQYLPAVEGDIDLAQGVAQVVGGVVEERTGFSILGIVILAWIATRLVATLRIVLRNTFQLDADRGLVRGKLFDLLVVVVGGILLLLNVGITVALQTVQALGEVLLGLDGVVMTATRWIAGQLAAFVSAWVLFFLLYRYVPARHVAWATAAVGATFTAVCYELMKWGFTWYVANLADFTNAYGSLAVVAILFFWIYYGSVVFILGGIVARSFEIDRRARGIIRN